MLGNLLKLPFYGNSFHVILLADQAMWSSKANNIAMENNVAWQLGA